jgi:hypothetical protein
MAYDHQIEAIQAIDELIIDSAACHDLAQVSSVCMIQYCLGTCFFRSCSIVHIEYGF